MRDMEFSTPGLVWNDLDAHEQAERLAWWRMTRLRELQRLGAFGAKR